MTAYRAAVLHPDIKRADELINLAVSRLPVDRDNCIYGWSGGKDALALQVICEEAGIKKCVFGTIGEEWEWPSFWRFANENAPAGCVWFNQNLDDEFMLKHPNLVFPQSADDAYAWYKICNQTSYYSYAKQVEAEHIILGHRTADGNNCKSSKAGKVYPMHDFSHEDIFCILAATGRKLPEIYFYPNGFYHGSHAWIMRGGKNAMDEVMQIDPSLLQAHSNIPKIHSYLKGEIWI